MRFCFIAPGYRVMRALEGDTRDAGGAETQMAVIATALASMGIEVELLYGDGAKSPSTHVVAGVTCIEAIPNWRSPRSLFAFIVALLQSKAHVFYANLPNDFLWIVGLIRIALPGPQFIYALASDKHCNPWETFDYHGWFHNPLYALGLQLATKITYQHEAQVAAIQPHIRADLFPTPNLIRSIAPAPRPFTKATIDVLWVALIRPVKQLEVLLDTAEQLQDIRFAVVGGFDALTLDQAISNTLEQRMRKLSNVRYLGPMQSADILQLVTSSKVLVNTSKWEGFPNTMLEAWSAGVPVISLNVDPGGVIRREDIGRVSGTVSQMIQDIRHLTQSAEVNHCLGVRGLVYVQHNHSLQAFYGAIKKMIPSVQ